MTRRFVRDVQKRHICAWHTTEKNTRWSLPTAVLDVVLVDYSAGTYAASELRGYERTYQFPMRIIQMLS